MEKGYIKFCLSLTAVHLPRSHLSLLCSSLCVRHLACRHNLPAPPGLIWTQMLPAGACSIKSRLRNIRLMCNPEVVLFRGAAKSYSYKYKMSKKLRKNAANVVCEICNYSQSRVDHRGLFAKSRIQTCQNQLQICSGAVSIQIVRKFALQLSITGYSIV